VVRRPAVARRGIRLAEPALVTLVAYQRRQPERSVLFQIIHSHLRTFQAMTEESGRPLPRYVWQEFERFIACGDLARGFARVICPACRYDRLVAFSCKTRSWCCACLGRFMNETAAYLVDHVIGPIPVRHWICTVPPPLRYLLAHDVDLCNEVLAAFNGAVFRWLRHQAKEELGLSSVSACCASVPSLAALTRTPPPTSPSPHRA